MPDTRRSILEQIINWALRPLDAGQPPYTNNTYWLYGMPGLGKTAVANSLCSRLHEHKKLGGSYFCRRDDPVLSEPGHVLPTLIYRLACMWPPYGKLVVQEIRRDPQLNPYSSSDVFFSKLLTRLERHPLHPYVLIIDALDECGSPTARKTILRVLGEACSVVNWLRIIIISRPEQDIDTFFHLASHPMSCLSRDLGQDDQSTKDIQLFAKARMESIGENRGVPPNWPSGDLISQLVESSDHLFIYIETGVRRACTEVRNTRTGVRFPGLPSLAQVTEASGCNREQDRRSQADDVQIEDGGWDNSPELEDIDLQNLDPEDILGESTDESETDSLFEEEHHTRKTHTRNQPKPRKTMIKGPVPGIKIGSLNVRGKRATTGGGNKDKLQMIRSWIRNNDITVTALVDTHWDDEYVKDIRLKNTQLFCSHETTNRGGIAFLIDTSKCKPTSISFKTLIEGRSGMLDIAYERQKLKLVVIYIPPERKEKIETIKSLRRKLRQEEDRENIIVMGDFNMVEEDIDREPCHPDDREIVNEFIRMKTELNLLEGWRHANPGERAYTWKGKQKDDYSFARIDRIYIENSLIDRTNEWKIEPAESRLSDHAGVTVKVLEPEPPFIGNGEWRLPLNILEHPHFKKRSTEIIEKLETELGHYLTELTKAKKDRKKIEKIRNILNPQTAWQSYKKAIRIAAQEAHSIRRKQITKERRALDREMRALQRKPRHWMTDEQLKDIRAEMNTTERKIQNLIEEHNTKAQATTAARWFKEDEKGSKLWYSTNKEKPRRQIFYTLFKEEEEETRNTEEMMEVAKRHHESLQRKQPMDSSRREVINKMLKRVSKRLKKEEANKLKGGITHIEIESTIRKSQTGKAPGCDGIPNEFWKHELERHKKMKKAGDTRPNIARLMKIVLTDIEIHGPIDEKFAEGRMSLLYKKKDIRNIENYRPVTLLNTDYKIYTTILTEKLKEVAPLIVNKDQAGFMPKRSIYDQTKLLELVIKLSENKHTNGMIMALDQEKAYDRIDHAYLWRTMRAFGIPKSFINKVRRLYGKAETAIRLNGCTTDAFRVERGVRQGDPLSCLLYNIAIEPLFELIRTSGLKGIQISKETFNALVMAYADDTTVYLSETDKLEILEECIDIFCKASTAKFNQQKTEIIPIGDPEYRRSLIEERTFNGKRIEDGIKIAKDGEPIRVLGSWQGNKVNADHKWTEIIEKQMKIMKMWSSSHPSVLARVRIAKSLVVSRALYLMTVNGIPKEYLETIDRNVRHFIWSGKKGPIAWERAIKSKREGGIGAPSIKLIYEATKIVWLRRWLIPGEARPKWAFAANEIIANARQNNPKVDENCITEWEEQRWNSKLNVEQMPNSLREMIKAAKRYNLKISVLRAPIALKLSMPAFFHPGSENNRKNNTRRAKCLRNNHAVNTINDLVTFALDKENNEEEYECELKTERCRQYAKELLRNLTNVWNPLTTTPTKNKLYHTPRRIEINRKANIKVTPITFNPDPQDDEEQLGNLRIFGSRTGYLKKPMATETPKNPLRMLRTPRKNENDEEIIVYTDGSAILNGWENSSAGIGIWHGHQSERNIAMKIDGKSLTNQRAELSAILIALQSNQEENLTIMSDSLTSLRAICYEITKWEDKGWHKVDNADILQAILHELRTRPNVCRFQWVKAHEDTEGNIEADSLAETGRLSNDSVIIEEINLENSRAIRDGAKLGKLEMKDIYSILVEQSGRKKGGMTHPEYLEDAKNMIEEETRLRPTDKKLIEGIWKLKVYNRLKDLIWSLLLGRLKIGTYWKKMNGYEERAICEACRRKGRYAEIETEHHLWLECENNGQKDAWKRAKEIWNKCTKKKWPQTSLGLLRGIGAITLSDANGRPLRTVDSERLRIIISLTMWTIWKTRNSITIKGENTEKLNNQKLLTDIMKDIISKTWNALKYETEARRASQEKMLKALWGNGKIATLERGKPPIFSL
jgi:ribonuclease HI/exonuclease III